MLCYVILSQASTRYSSAVHIMLEIGLCLRKEILQSPTEQEYNTLKSGKNTEKFTI